MGLETLLEAAKYLEYRAEVESSSSLLLGEKGLSSLPTNGTSGAISTPQPNGYLGHRSIVPNGLHFVSQNNGQQFKAQPHLSSSLNSATSLQRVPESNNGYKDHAYRRITHSSHSPDFDFYNGTNRMAKSVSPSNISGLNSRNSGTREVHNKLEKNRRAHLKECFELLKSQLPAFEDRKISNLAILRSSLRHIQTLKRKEREYEHEMERLAREKIALQQRLSMMKKDMAGKWEHSDWRTMIPDGVDLEMDRINCRRSPTSTETTLTLSPDRMLLENHRSSESSDSSSPASNHVSRHDIEYEDSQSECDSQHPLSLTVNNCHITEQKMVPKKFYGQINGVNGIPENGPISLVTTTKLSSSPLAAITVDKIASSPIGGATYINSLANNSGKTNGYSIMSSSALINSKIDIGQYYEEEKKVCK